MLGFRSKLFIFCILISRIGGESLRDKIPCIENDKFYRNPNRDPAAVWSQTECANYYFCVEGEVFEFTCSTGLTFDINRQICDFKPNVGNCDVTAEETTPKPLFNTKEPICPTGELACADGTCLPTALFCDGHPGNYFLFRKETLCFCLQFDASACNDDKAHALRNFLIKNNMISQNLLKIALMEVTKAGAIQNMIQMLPNLVTTPIVHYPIVFAPLMEH